MIPRITHKGSEVRLTPFQIRVTLNEHLRGVPTQKAIQTALDIKKKEEFK